MRVRCETNRGVDLPVDYLDIAGGFTRETIFPLRPGAEYIVYALTVRRGGIWYYLIDERGVNYPVWSPAPLFTVTDSRISRYWLFGFRDLGSRNGDAVFAFSEWATNPMDYYDRLSDGDMEAVLIFRKYRGLMDLEFEDEAVQDTASVVGDGWLMCPSCRAAWQSSVAGSLISCPNCSARLRNPSLSSKDS